MLRLIDLIAMAGVFLGHYKIHCATSIHTDPLVEFFNNRFQEWQEDQNQKNFSCDNVVSLIQIESGKWLFAGVFKILSVKKIKNKEKKKYTYLYQTEEMPGLEHLVGRVIVYFDKKFRASYLVGNNFEDKLIVHEIRSIKMSIGDFPGYDSTIVSYDILNIIAKENNPSWKSALENVSGIYIITDKSNGKNYVGSAYGEGGLWGRFISYQKNGHGGNKKLKELLKTQGDEHAKNFQFTIAEVFGNKTGEEYILQRESHWKNVLLTREFGYNDN
jgi:hypothetical protein